MKNRLKELLQSGRSAIGTILQIPSASVAQILAQAGFDWLVIDTEHGPIDIETLHAMFVATRGTDATPVVRVARNLDWLAKRVLDVGALGVMMPGVNSEEEAHAAVAAVRYPGEGVRGFGPAFAASHWGVPVSEYVKNANREVMAIVQIEHIDAVERIDRILAVPGIDLPLIGPYDLSGSMGLLGQVEHPEVQRAIDRVLAAAKRAGLPAGIFGGMAEEADAYHERGFQAVLVGVDAAFLTAGATSTLSRIKRR